MTVETQNGNANLGNTNQPTFRLKCRNAIITLPESYFEHQDKIISHLEHYKAFQYILICEHDGPEKVHRHIYVQYDNARTLDSRYLPGCHLEESRGSAQKNIQYLMAEDTKHKRAGVHATVIYENGKASLRGNVNTVRDLKKITDINEVPTQHLNTWFKVRQSKTKVGQWHKDVEVIYIWGPSKTGKSYMAEHTLIDRRIEDFTEVKYNGSFWLNVTGIEVDGAAIYDDFRDSHMPASEFINFIDYNIHNLNYKGGSALNKFNLIIITSIQSPEEIYKKLTEEPKKQWLRRMKIIHLTEIHKDRDDNNEPLEDVHGDELWQKQLAMLNAI